MRKVISNNFVLILIIMFGAFLRFYHLSSNPPSLNWDEVSHGYNAYSILKTGKDEWGQTFPTIFRAYGDYKLPVYIYATVLPILLLGLNAFSIRLISAIAGTLTIFFTYKLSSGLFKHDKNQNTISLISAFLVSIQPWTLFLSRGAFEANLSLSLIVSGFYFLQKGIRSTKNIIIGVILLGFSVWTYNSARVFVPMMLLAYVSIYFRELKNIYEKSRKLIIVSLLTILLFFVPMVFQLINPEGSARYESVTLVDQGLVNRINEARNSNDLSPVVEKIIYNKVSFALPVVVSNWMSHYSQHFMFLQGGTNYQFSVPNKGLMFSINILFFYLGIILSIVSVFKKRDIKIYLFILSWFVIGSIASSITREAPHTLRAITIIPTPMILTSIGVVWFANKFGKIKNILISIYVVIILLSLAEYLHNYFGDYRKNYSWSWQYGNEQMVDYVKDNYEEYAKIIITKKYGEPHEFILFYWPWNPKDYQDDLSKIRYYQSDWYWIDKFDKFYFVNDWEVVGSVDEPRSPTKFILESRSEEIDCSQIKCLIVTSSGNIADGWNKLETIYFLDGKPAYEIYEN